MGISYLGPDRGVFDSMWVGDPRGAGLELDGEELGIFGRYRILG